MPRAEIPHGTLVMLILKVLQHERLHGYAIAQRIKLLSSSILQVEEGSLYPALQKMLVNGWVTSEWGTSETNRRVRVYRIAAAGRRQLADELAEFERANEAIRAVLRGAQ
jgi:transcriptional regulator